MVTDLNPVGSEPAASFSGIQSPMNLKDKSIFQRKDLQLHSSLGRGRPQRNKLINILSPEQIKFNQRNLQKRFEDEDHKMQPSFHSANTKRVSTNNSSALRVAYNAGSLMDTHHGMLAKNQQQLPTT